MQDDAHERGVAIRREMFPELTDAHLADVDDFNRDLQDLVTRYCFGEVWTREDLSRGTRSMLTIALLAAQGRTKELEWHVRGAIRNGVTPVEIREVLLHVAIYAGIPAAVSGFMAAREVLKELGEL